MTNHSSLNRREFIAGAALAAAALGAGTSSTATARDIPAGPSDEWFDRPMRWMQLVLAEDDPGQYDSKFWLDYFKRVHADAACLSAGGCVAYYPKKIKFHHASSAMKEGSPQF